jgi:large repetitive protein
MRKYLVAVLTAAALVTGVITANPASALSPTTGDISGIVTDVHGAPIAGAAVNVDGQPAVTTDGTGVYTIADVAPGTVLVTASASGFVPAPLTQVAVNANATTTQDFSLVANSTISGVAYDPSANPLAGVDVSVSGPSTESTTSAGDGSYAFTDLAPGTYTVDFASSDPSLVAPATQTVTITDGGSLSTIDGHFLAGATITGLVNDPSNNPATGVTVTATGPVSLSTTTDGSGAYSLVGLAPGDYSLSFHLNGYLDPAAITVTVADFGTTVAAPNVALVAPSTVSGTVTDSSAAPVADAVVSIDGPSFAQTTTAGDGTYSFTGLAAGDYTLTVSAPGFVDATAPVSITTAGDTVTQDVTLQKASKVDVFVADTHAVPVSGAAVTVTSVADGSTLTGSTDASGHVVIDGLVPGDYTVTSTADGYFTAPPVPLTVTALETTYPLDVPVLSPGSVSGIVTDPTGAPLAGATVSLEGAGVNATTTSAADGSFTFNGLDLGQYTVKASNPLYVSPTPQIADVTDYGMTTTVALQFTAGSTINGEATVNEAPLAGVTVTIDGPVTVTTTTDGDGLYSVGVLPVGTYTVSFDASGYISPADQSVTISTPGSTTTVNGELNLPATISGTVTDPTGAPLAGVSVTADGPVFTTATTGPDGTYSLTGLDKGTYTVSFHADGFIDPTPKTVTIDTYGQTVASQDAQVNAPSTISGVVSNSSANPIEGATVTIDGPTWATTTTAADGTYSFGVLPPGSYDLTVTADGFVDSSTVTVTVPGFGSNVTQDVTLLATSSADVLVTDASLNPIDGATVNVSSADSTFVGTTDATGHAIVTGLPIGTYTVSASAAGYLDGTTTVTITAEATTESASVSLNAVDQIKGTITDTVDVPIAGATITATNSEGVRTTVSAADGTYLFTDLGPDTYTFSVSADGYITPLDSSITVTGFGSTVTHDVALYKVGEVVAPDAPANVVAVAGDGTVTVMWDAPAHDGGVPIYKYTVTATSAQTGLSFFAPTDGSCTTDPSVTACNVDGLTNGTAYTFSVVATNIAGDSPAATTSATPFGLPTPPSNVKAYASNAQVKFTWTRGNGNGSTITRYVVRSSPLNRVCVTAGTTCTVTGLKDGVLYTFSVVSQNAAGQSDPVTIKARPPFVPTVTSIKSKAGKSGQATITFKKPNTKEAIVDYKIEILLKKKWVTYKDGKSTKTSILVKGLSKKTSYKGRITPIPSKGQALTSPVFTFKTG